MNTEEINKLEALDKKRKKEYFIKYLPAFIDFMQTYKVEVLVQSDYMYHCYINYKQGDGSYSSDFDFLSATVNGIINYCKQNNIHTFTELNNHINTDNVDTYTDTEEFNILIDKINQANCILNNELNNNENKIEE